MKNFEQVISRLQKNYYEECQNFTGPDVLDDRSTLQGYDGPHEESYEMQETLAVRKLMDRAKGYPMRSK